MSVFQISKEFTFSASHELPRMPEGHQCRRLHGHNYVVRVLLRAEELDAFGMVLDYGDLGTFRQFIDDTLDHRHLNEALPEMEQPTAERLAAFLASVAVHLLDLDDEDAVLVAVEVSETPKTWAGWYPYGWERTRPPAAYEARE